MSNKLTQSLDRLTGKSEIATLRAEVRQLRSVVEESRRAVDESRRLNERLSDVLDVVTELLVPAVDRNDERLAAALEKL